MSVRILEGDALTVLRTLPDQSVQCCVTSPPYFGLRDYGVAGQLGLEKTPDLYVEAMVGVFSEVKRVLRDDGTLWLNIGDSYAGSWGAQSRPNGSDIKSTLQGGSMLSARQIEARPRMTQTGSLKNTPGCKPKDLIGIPWMLAFALRADGWYLRSDIIWHKPSTMPESITDRPTKAHEYVFLFAKAERYFYDADAIAEPLATASISRLAQDVEAQQGSSRVPGKTNGTMKAVSRNPSKEYNTGPKLSGGAPNQGGNHQTSAGLHRNGGNAQRPDATTRNARTVWSISPQPFREAHFATFPPRLAERCILAGSAKGQTVLDPFGGAGTTGLVADRLGRDALLIELNPAYAKMARERIHSDNPLFGDVA